MTKTRDFYPNGNSGSHTYKLESATICLGSVVTHPPARAGDAGYPGWIPGLGRSPGGGNGNPLQCCCLESLIGHSPRGCKESGMTESLSTAPEDSKDKEECKKFPELDPCGSVAAPFNYNQTSGIAGEIPED